MVDAASVATPTNTHYAIARALLTKGKHVLVEKPITDNTAHATELAELATRSGLILQVGHVERFNPVLGALETHLTHPRLIEAHRLSPYTERSTEIGSRNNKANRAQWVRQSQVTNSTVEAGVSPAGSLTLQTTRLPPQKNDHLFRCR